MANNTPWIDPRTGRPRSSISSADRAPLDPRERLLYNAWAALQEGIHSYNPMAMLARAITRRIPIDADFRRMRDEENARRGHYRPRTEANRRAQQADEVNRDEREYRAQAAQRRRLRPARGGVERSADIAGNLLGSAAAGLVSDPTTLIAPGRTLVQKLVGQAAIGGAEDAGQQGLEIHEGVRDEFDPTELAISTAAGPIVVGAVHAAGARGRRAAREDAGWVDGPPPREAAAPEPQAERRAVERPADPTAHSREQAFQEHAERTGQSRDELARIYYGNEDSALKDSIRDRTNEIHQAAIVDSNGGGWVDGPPPRAVDTAAGEPDQLVGLNGSGKGSIQDVDVRSTEGLEARMAELESDVEHSPNAGTDPRVLSPEPELPLGQTPPSVKITDRTEEMGDIFPDAHRLYKLEYGPDVDAFLEVDRHGRGTITIGGEGPNTLGPGVLRALMRDVNRQIPEVTIIEGGRATGARRGQPIEDAIQSVEMNRTRPKEDVPLPLDNQIDPETIYRELNNPEPEAPRVEPLNNNVVNLDEVRHRKTMDENNAALDRSDREYVSGLEDRYWQLRHLHDSIKNGENPITAGEAREMREEGGIDRLRQNMQDSRLPALGRDVVDDMAKLWDDIETGLGTTPEPTGPRRAGNVNLDRIASSDDIDDVLRQTAENMERAGTAPESQTRHATEELADELGVSTDDLLKHVPDLTPEKALAFRNLMRESANRVVELSRRLNAGENSSAVRESLTHAWVVHGAMQEKMSAITANLARTLDSYNIKAKGGQDYAAALRSIPNDLFGDKGNIERLAQLIETHADNPAAVNRIVRESVKKRAEDYIFSAWYNMMLSGPQTHAANVMGTASNYFVDLAEHGMAAILGQRRRWSANADRVMGREVLARIYGGILGAGRGFKQAGTAFRLGTPLDMVGRTENPRAFTGTLTQAIETPTRSLAAEDEFFRAVTHMSDLYGMAVRTAAKEGETGRDLLNRAGQLVENPTEEMLAHASDYARLIRFQDEPGVLGKMFESARQRRAGDPIGTRLMKSSLRVIVPFVRTPSSLLRTAIRRSPAGVIESRNVADFRAGGARRDLALSRVAMGSAVTSAMAMWALDGTITGTGPQDYRRRLELEASGWRPNSIKIGNEYISYAGLEPLSILLSTVATMTDRAQATAANDDDYLDKAAQMSVALGDVLSDNTWTENLASFFQILGAPAGQQMAAFKNFATNLVGGAAVPAILRQVNQAYVDPVQRITTGDGSLGQRITGRIEAGVPGLSDNLPAARDVYGREVVREGNLGPDLLSRMRMSTADPDPTVRELQRLSTGEHALVGPPGIANINVHGTRRRLTAPEFAAYQHLSGTYILEDMRTQIADPAWKTMTDEERQDEVRRTVRESRANAREDLFSGEEAPPLASANPAPASAANDEWVDGPPTERAVVDTNALIASFRAGRFESGRRTPEGNRAVGGVDNSHHLDGDGADFVPAQGQSLRELAAQAREHFGPSAHILVHRGHVHVTLRGLNAPYFGANGVR